MNGVNDGMDEGDYDGDDEDNRCERCGGEGFIEYNDAPDTWGEDCPSEANHLVSCPDCGGTGDARIMKTLQGIR